MSVIKDYQKNIFEFKNNFKKLLKDISKYQKEYSFAMDIPSCALSISQIENILDIKFFELKEKFILLYPIEYISDPENLYFLIQSGGNIEFIINSDKIPFFIIEASYKAILENFKKIRKLYDEQDDDNYCGPDLTKELSEELKKEDESIKKLQNSKNDLIEEFDKDEFENDKRDQKYLFKFYFWETDFYIDIISKDQYDKLINSVKEYFIKNADLSLEVYIDDFSGYAYFNSLEHFLSCTPVKKIYKQEINTIEKFELVDKETFNIEKLISSIKSKL